MSRIFFYIIVVLIAILGISFACLNAQTVQFNYYINSISIPLSLLLALTFALGGFVALLFCLKIVLNSKRQMHKLKVELREADKRTKNVV